MDKKDNRKKQLVLRLSHVLWQDLAKWADEDFRSLNAQIEYLLTQCVKKRKKSGSDPDVNGTSDR